MVIEKLEINDPTGVYSNITDLLDEIRAENIKCVSIVYERKDGSTRTFWSGWERIHLVGILQQLQFDMMAVATTDAKERSFSEALKDDN